MENIQYIYFDLDDTLLDHSHAERAALTATIDDFGLAFEGHDKNEVLHEYHQVNLVLWRDYSLGHISKQDLQGYRFQRLLDKFGISEINAKDVGDTYLSHYPNHWQYCDGAEQVFHDLADKYPVGVITNGFENTQKKKLNAFADMRERLQSIVISETTGFLKPDIRLFEFAAEEAQIAPENILYIGDSYESDVEGAQKAGWQIAWYVPDQNRRRPTDAYTFESWDEFNIDVV